MSRKAKEENRGRIEVGQTVRLKNLNRVYTTFSTAFKKLGFNNIVRNPENVISLKEFKGDFFKVFSVPSENGNFGGLIGIQNDQGIQLLVDAKGVNRIKRGKVTNYSTTL
mgnify:CR=1 FL=1